MTATIFQHLNDTLCPLSPRSGKVYAFFDFLKCMNTILQGFQMTVTIFQHLKLHNLFVSFFLAL